MRFALATFLVLLACLALALAGPQSRPPVTATGPARDVVIYPPILWDYLTVDGTDAHVLGIAGYLRKSFDSMLLAPIFPSVASVRSMSERGAIPRDMETILELSPGAVLISAGFADPLRAIGAPVVEYGSSAPREIDAMLLDWEFLGRLTGQQQRVVALQERYRSAVSALESEVPRGAPKPLRVLYTYGTTNGITSAAPEGSLEATALEKLGAINLGSDLYRGALNNEELLRLDPDVVFIYGVNDTRPRDWYGDPALAALAAVRERRVYVEPVGGSRMSGPVEFPLRLRWMAEILYPVQLSRTLREEFRKTYAEVYGYTLTDRDLDVALKLTDNERSAGYDRFRRRG